MLAATLILAQKNITPFLNPTNPTNLKAAAAYSKEQRGISMLVMVDGKIVHEEYPLPLVQRRGMELASGTKSFAGVAAAFLVAENKLKWQDPVSKHIPEWANDKTKQDITIHQLLTLTSGIKTGGERGNVMSYTEALKQPIVTTPGKNFRYGATAFQVWGEVVKRLTNKTQVEYLQQKLFTPLGIKPEAWKTAENGDPMIPHGARFTARNWATFGEFMRQGGIHNGKQLIKTEFLTPLWRGTQANPSYGITWWLSTADGNANTLAMIRRGSATNSNQGIPNDLVMAAGAGNQRLYISKSQKLVVVRQASGIRRSMNGDRTNFSDITFIRLLTTGKK